MATIPALNFTVKQSIYTVVVMLKYSGELKHAQENSKGGGGGGRKDKNFRGDEIFLFFHVHFLTLSYHCLFN